MTSAEIVAALKAAKPGDKVTIGPVEYRELVRLSRLDLEGVTLDARGAVFHEGLDVSSVIGLNIVGGQYGTDQAQTTVRFALTVSGCRDISVAEVRCDTPYGADRGGVRFRNCFGVTLRDSALFNHATGISVLECDGFLVTRNYVEPRIDGMNIAGSRQGIVGANECHNKKRWGTSHPDGIQLWSLADKPLQSDIWLVNNKVTGDTQGILSSDPKTGSGTKLRFHGNYIAVTFSHTITAGAVTDSVATDNVLASWPGAYFGDLGGSLKGFEHPSNTVARNVRANGKVTLPPRVWWLGVPDVWPVGSRFDDRSFNPVAVEVKLNV